jgi:hypothetical protein
MWSSVPIRIGLVFDSGELRRNQKDNDESEEFPPGTNCQVIREATVEEWTAYLKDNGFGPPMRDYGGYLYLLSVD